MKKMNKKLYDLHLQVGGLCGKNLTCGNKVNYKTEETATKSAMSMNEGKKKMRNIVEAYPCAFCKGWHIGRKMSIEEMEEYIRSK